MKTSENVVKSDVSKRFRDEVRNFFFFFFFFEMKERCSVFCENNYLADSLGSQYLLKILQTSLTVKNSENVVKTGCFEKRLRRRAPNFF